ncbi:hypothetical protein GS485_17500 [Rhodococcus hoagii]|nr:hypothetical protein [Prescottella equi]
MVAARGDPAAIDDWYRWRHHRLQGRAEGQLTRLQGGQWPLMVDRVAWVADTSPWTITDARMDRYWDVMQEVCKTNNIVPQVNLYIHVRTSSRSLVTAN